MKPTGLPIQDQFTGKYTANKRYRLRNPEYYWKHREDCLSRQKRYELRHPGRGTELRRLSDRSYNLKHRGERRRYSLQHRYGITPEEFDALLGMQGHCCAICGNGFKSPKDCQIDHDHVTGKVRGLLCRTCNLALGYIHDNPTYLENAAKYLKGERGPIVRLLNTQSLTGSTHV